MCALVLTIPFGFFQYFDTGFFALLKQDIEDCRSVTTRDEFDRHYSVEYENILNNIASCIMASLSTLIMALIYYLFKPNPFEMEVFMRFSGKILVVCMVILTTAAIFSLMLCTLFIFMYIAMPEDFCDYNTKSNQYYDGGLITVLVSLGVSVTLMNLIG